MDSYVLHRIQEAASALKGLGAKEVYVFGSAATGKMREGSDVDLAVTGLPPKEFFHAMGRASEVIGRQVHLVDLDDDTPFTRYLREEGELHIVA